MSSANRESPPRPTPSRGNASGERAAAGPATIRALPPPPQLAAAGKGTPSPLPSPQTILGYAPPVEPGPAEGVPEDQLAPGAIVGDYEIVELIGAGGMGSVYAARNPLIDRQVAIKVIASHLCRDPDVVQQFVIEARAANQIANRHVVDIHTLGTLADGRPYLVMELLRGETLTQRLSYGPLDVDDAVPILDQIAEAMEAAHAVPIVHRDLKPDNVFLEDGSDGPQVKILDFGIAKLADSGTAGNEDDGSHANAMLVGTPHYMAPEQARAQLVGTPADLYALGLIAFEMLAGRPAFDGETPGDVLVAQLQATPPRLADLRPDAPEGLDEMVEQLLLKDPSMRPTATDVRRALRALYAPRTYPRVVPPVELPFREQVRLWLQRPRNRLLLAAQIVIALLMVSAYLFIGDGDEPAASAASGSGAAAATSGAAPAAATPRAAPAPASARTQATTPPDVPAPTSPPASASTPGTESTPPSSGAAPSAPAAAPAMSPSAPAAAAPAEPVVAPLEVPAGTQSAEPPVDRDAPIRDPF
jgi:serine/threonine-protein kinase